MDDNTTKKLEQVLDRSLYGQGDAKSWESLIEEIETGECHIVWSDNFPVREVSVLRIEVIASEDSQFPGAYLYKVYQEFSDGRRRKRKLSGLSEKIKPGEDLDKAAARAISEELGIDSSLAAIQIDPCQEVFEEESPSYPGLMSRYLFYIATAHLDASVVKEFYVEIQKDKQTLFRWR